MGFKHWLSLVNSKSRPLIKRANEKFCKLFIIAETLLVFLCSVGSETVHWNVLYLWIVRYVVRSCFYLHQQKSCRWRKK